MQETSELSRARKLYDAHAWQDAFDAFAAGDAQEPADLDQWAVSAHLLGRLGEYFQIRERCYRLHVDRGELVPAARAALWIGMQKMVEGQVGPGTGWLARAGRHVEEAAVDCAEVGYLQLAGTFELAGAGDIEGAALLAGEATATAERFGDRDLAALARHQHGLILLAGGSTAPGLALLDEAMVALTAGELSPMITGIVYCGVIQGCWDVYELRRAQEWTAAMTRWCDDQPQLANFTGECKVRRAELKQLHGAWADALDELGGVGTSDVDSNSAAAAAYVRGNLDRLQGRFDEADEEYADAARLGIDPQPGLAQLRLARGSAQAAAAMTRRALAETREPGRRIELLFAAVEVLLAVDDTDEAAEASGELSAFAAAQASPVVEALAQQAQASVDLHGAQAQQALGRIRVALGLWLRVRAPYQEALARVLLSAACRALGDPESADRELGTARGIFADLGAVPDLARTDAPGQPRDTGGLSPRELEVLRLVATGSTNKRIAAQLVLSERTVDRHVSNIFGKLGVSSRSAATAYAFERQLV